MRTLLALGLSLLSISASAQINPQMAFLSRQVAEAKDPRARAQSALLLGGTHDPASMTPLCRALKDPEPVVRGAAAKALGELGDRNAVACLQTRRSDPNSDVQFAVARAIASIEAPGGGALYVSIAPAVDKSGGGVAPEALRLSEELLRRKLSSMGVHFAPPGEDKRAAMAVLREKRFKGWLLMLQLQPHTNGGLKVSLLCLTYPEQQIRGDYSVKASGAKAPDLLKLMVPKVVDDAADDLEWSR